MNKDEAKLFLFERAIQQAQSTMFFMHNCLTNPKQYKYAYPNLTLHAIKTLEALVKPVDDFCPHSKFTPNCPQCQHRSEEFKKFQEAKKVLGVTVPEEPKQPDVIYYKKGKNEDNKKT